MAKDTEKLIRQLSLISYLMAERRPVTALEIRRDVEGYSGMNEDAFARRFYADRSELESLRIQLTVTAPPTAPPSKRTIRCALRTSICPRSSSQTKSSPRCRLRCIYSTASSPTPSRCGLRCSRSPGGPEPAACTRAALGGAGHHRIGRWPRAFIRLAKIETAIFRNKTITFDYYTMARDEIGSRRVNPYHLLFQGGEFYLLGYAHEREQIRVFRLSRIRGKVSYATKAEHDFRRPADFDPREYAGRSEWQLGDEQGVAEVLLSERIAWQIERHFGRYGEMTSAEGEGHNPGDRLLRTSYSSARMLVSWVLGLGENARLLGPPALVEELARRLALLEERHSEGQVLADSVPRIEEPPLVAPTRSAAASAARADRRAAAVERDPQAEAAIRPERFARLVTLASILIHAGRRSERVKIAELCESLQLSDEELREDINVLNVVNFGGGSYVLYAEILKDEGEIDVDPEPYSDNFDRPARLLPVEAKALVAAIDLVGEHIPEGSLSSAREKIVAALGEDPMEQGLQVAHATSDDSEVARIVSRAIVEHRLLELDYYKANEDEFSLRRVEPYALTNGQEGWYVASFDPTKQEMRHFRLDRIRRAHVTDEVFEPRPEVDPGAEVEGWMRTGEVQASRAARVWISPERARWAREQRRVVDELVDGSIVVQLSFAGTDWLVREVLKEAGDAVVLEPADAREAVLAAVQQLRAVPAGVS